MCQYSCTITTFRVVICSGSCFHSFCQCFIWPATRVSNYCKLSSVVTGSGTSDSIVCALALGNLQFLRPYQVMLIGVDNI